jgi:hypothetical protein
MWIGKDVYRTMNSLIESAQNRNTEMLKREGALRQQVADLERENGRMRADMDWFKLRLNQVERERGQLIQAAIGVKIAVPEFVPTYEDPGAALNDTPILSTLGEDALDQFAPKMEGDADYSNLPGYTRQK